MEKQGDEVHVSEEEARGASTPHIVRYVLLFSLVLAIIALSAIWMSGAYLADNDTGGYSETRRAVAETE